MRKLLFLLLVLLLTAVVTACDSGVDEFDSEKAAAKVSGDATETEDVSKDEASEESDEVAGEEEAEDIWTYYDNATWEEDFNGLHTEIQKVVVTEKAPTIEDENAEVSAVGIKFLVENTTEDKTFTTYPDQATLVTSTGEQIDMPDMFLSDHLGGDIHEGVIKEGDVIWYLERGEAEAIEWIKLEWNSTDTKLEGEGDYENAYHTHEVKLDLK